MNNKLLIAAIALMVAAVALPSVNANHVQKPNASYIPPPVLGATGLTVDDWVTMEDQVALCESNGWWDSVNFDPSPHAGFGGVCYASPKAPAAITGGASEPASTLAGVDTCTQDSLLGAPLSGATAPGAILGNELTPGCQEYGPYPFKKDNKSYVCVHTDIIDLLPPYNAVFSVSPAGSAVPATIRAGSEQHQASSAGACIFEDFFYYSSDGSMHAALFPAMAWLEPFPGGAYTPAPPHVPCGPAATLPLCLGNVPGNAGEVIWEQIVPAACDLNGDGDTTDYGENPCKSCKHVRPATLNAADDLETVGTMELTPQPDYVTPGPSPTTGVDVFCVDQSLVDGSVYLIQDPLALFNQI